ncbi:MAG: hypothetical protein U1F77_02950 [Kiritimatiellia bacterium]
MNNPPSSAPPPERSPAMNLRSAPLRAQVPFWFSAAILLALLGFFVCRSGTANGGRPAYTLDDAYIHLAMARNAVEHGQLGVNPGEFSAASSSPLWSLLLVAGIRLVGDREWLPFVWAALSATGCLWLANRFGRARGLRGPGRLAACLMLLYATPLPALVSTGMEHATHLFFMLLLVSRAYDLLENGERASLPQTCVAAFLATGFRYESLFLAAPLALVLWLRGRFRAGALLSIAAFLPVAAFGAYSLAHGSDFLPNSLALKGHFPSADGLKSLVSTLGYHGFGKLVSTPHLLSLFLLLLLGLRRLPSPAGPLFWLSACLGVAMFIHLQLAETGWFFRYEAYLVGLGVVLLACLFPGPARMAEARGAGAEARIRKIALVALVVLLLWPLHQRGKEALENIVPASRDIHRQHRQLAEFLRSSFPPGTHVAINDIGLVSYAGGCRVLDLWGLGSHEVTVLRKQRRLTSRDIAGLLERTGTRYVMIYNSWFPDLPPALVHAGDWTLEDAYLPVWNQTVSFYGVGEEAAAELGAAMKHFGPRLPGSVKQTFADEPAPPEPR